MHILSTTEMMNFVDYVSAAAELEQSDFRPFRDDIKYRITRIHKVLHALSNQGYLRKACKICGGTKCNWCDPDNCRLPDNVGGNPMNKEWILRRKVSKLKKLETIRDK